jgi:long-chain acyl-CoA synthetase
MTKPERPLPLDPAQPAAFHWHDATTPLTRAGSGDLVALRDAIRAREEFSVTPDGISPVVGGTAGYLRIRSGGTTGPAKTIRRTHHSWIASFEVNRAHLGLGAADVYGILGRPVHSLALYAIVEAAHVGADIVDLAGLRPVHQVAGLVERVATVLYATPTQLRLLKSVGRQLPTLRHVLCGGGHMGQDLRHEVQRIAPNATVTEFYGAAETSFIAWSDGSWPEGSVGQAYPGVEICIDPPGADLGTIWVKSPYLFEGYAEGQSPDTQWQDGFVTVGEVGHLAEDGSLSIAGRKNRMVTIADQNVFPEDIELFFLALQGVTHAVVLPRSDQDRGTVLVALIDALPENMTVDDLLRAGRKRFGALAAPRRIFVAEDFPVTASGKPDLLRATHLIEAQE